MLPKEDSRRRWTYSIMKPEALRRLEEGDEDLLSELIDLFLATRRASGIGDAVARQDWAALAASAHSLKGSCGSLGALRSRLCGRLEMRAPAADREPSWFGSSNGSTHWFARRCSASGLATHSLAGTLDRAGRRAVARSILFAVPRLLRGMFDAADRAQLAELGIAAAEVERQLRIFAAPPPAVVLDRPCTVGDGIAVLDDAERQQAVASAMSAAAAAGRLLKFVPASGAATRMFQALLAVRAAMRRSRRAPRCSARAAAGDAEAREALVVRRTARALPVRRRRWPPSWRAAARTSKR